MSKSIVKRIKKFNERRNPELLPLKYQALKESPFRFFRGTCHLFYEDLPKKSFIFKSPLTWVCGDLHLENFGSFKADNRLAYFDMNDFDEAFLAPCLVDVVRLSTSIFLVAPLLGISKPQSQKLVEILLQSYRKILATGYIRFIEKETAKGVVKEFLDKVSHRTRKALLAQRIKLHKNQVLIRHDGIKTLKAGKKTKLKVKTAIEKWAQKNTSDSDFYRVKDVALRASGTGSIGIERYLVLINGKGGKEGYYLLDIKEALYPSSLQFLKLKTQPRWKHEAERVIEIQKRVQAASPAFLNELQIGKEVFMIRELQPTEDRIDFRILKKDFLRLGQLMRDAGAIMAWNNLRCSGRQGSAIADDLMQFGKKMDKIEKEIIAYSQKYAVQTVKYWKEFKLNKRI